MWLFFLHTKKKKRKCKTSTVTTPIFLILKGVKSTHKSLGPCSMLDVKTAKNEQWADVLWLAFLWRSPFWWNPFYTVDKLRHGHLQLLSAYTRTPGLGFSTKSGVFSLQRGNQEVIHSWNTLTISTCCSIIYSENRYSFHPKLIEHRIQVIVFKTEQITELLPLETGVSTLAERSWYFPVEIN